MRFQKVCSTDRSSTATPGATPSRTCWWVLCESLTCMRIAGIVLKMIFKSIHADLASTYWISKSIIRSKVVRFFPLTCHQPVRPGSVSKRRKCLGWYFSHSYGRQGRGPTKLISPRIIFSSWGNSSIPVVRSREPNGMSRGSAGSSFVMGRSEHIKLFRWALCSALSALTAMVRNLYISKF